MRQRVFGSFAVNLYERTANAPSKWNCFNYITYVMWTEKNFFTYTSTALRAHMDGRIKGLTLKSRKVPSHICIILIIIIINYIIDNESSENSGRCARVFSTEIILYRYIISYVERWRIIIYCIIIYNILHKWKFANYAAHRIAVGGGVHQTK